MNKNNYYVYMYLDTDNVPFYIGKGKGQRYQVGQHDLQRQPFLYNKIHKIGLKNVRVHVVNKDLVEKHAIAWEVYWIRHIGRRDQGKGPLCNLTNGGDGLSGHIPSKETRQKMSTSLRGRARSEETKRKISESSMGKIMSQSARDKIRLANIGRTISPEGKLSISKTHKGKHVSLETRARMSASIKQALIKRKHIIAINEET